MVYLVELQISFTSALKLAVFLLLYIHVPFCFKQRLSASFLGLYTFQCSEIQKLLVTLIQYEIEFMFMSRLDSVVKLYGNHSALIEVTTNFLLYPKKWLEWFTRISRRQRY